MCNSQPPWEALADKVGPDGVHGIAPYADAVVVGDYLGAQMSAFDHEPALGLIDHLADGKINTIYPTRTMVIAGVPFLATRSGALPTGMTFDGKNGELSGTPTESGVFTFKVRATATNQPVLEKSYTFAIAAANVILPPHSTLDIVAEPLNSGDASDIGLYTNGTIATITAKAGDGFKFARWTDNGAYVSSDALLEFPVTLNRSLVAHFVAGPPRLSNEATGADALRLSWTTNAVGYVLQRNSDPVATGWVMAPNPVIVVGDHHQVTIAPLAGRSFFRLKSP